MTAREAYDSDPTFRALVDVWAAERRCPLVLKDRCLELDLPGAAACAAWAAAQPERQVFAPRTSGGERGGSCGPYPTMNDPNRWYWRASGGGGRTSCPSGTSERGWARRSARRRLGTRF